MNAGRDRGLGRVERGAWAGGRTSRAGPVGLDRQGEPLGRDRSASRTPRPTLERTRTSPPPWRSLRRKPAFPRSPMAVPA